MFFLYVSVAAAIALLVLINLGLTSSNIILDGSTPCGKNGTGPDFVDSNGISSAGCVFSQASLGAPNATGWRGEVRGLSTLDGDVKITLQPQFPSVLPLSISFFYSAELRGRRLGGQNNLIMTVANSSAQLSCVSSPNTPVPWSCQPIPLLDTSVITGGQGSGGYDTYSVTVIYQGENWGPVASEPNRCAHCPLHCISR